MRPPLHIQGSLLARNAILNVVGQLVPVLVAVITIPYVIHGLGLERFGVLSLGWVLIGYFSLFDLGLARATTKFVAEALARNDRQRVAATIWTSLAMQALLGAAAAGIVYACSPILVHRVFQIPGSLTGESVAGIRVLAAALVPCLCGGSARGALEAAQRFDLVNGVRVATTSLGFLLPAAGVYWGFGLVEILGLLALVLAGSAMAYLSFAIRALPELTTGIAVDGDVARRLFGFGGWVTLSSILVPIIIYADRMLLAALASATALALYTVPYEMVARMQILPSSLGGTLFPAFSSVAAIDSTRIWPLYRRSVRYLLLVMAPVAGAVVLFAGDILRIWLGDDFSHQSATVLQLLSLGMLLNALSQMPANLLDAVGRPDLRAKVFLSYTGGYLLLAWVLIRDLGVVGAAMGWTIRAAVELTLFSLVAARHLQRIRAGSAPGRGGRVVAVVVSLGLPIAFLLWVGAGAWIRIAGFMCACAIFYLGSWFYVLDGSERVALSGVLGGIARRKEVFGDGAL